MTIFALQHGAITTEKYAICSFDGNIQKAGYGRTTPAIFISLKA
jgi:hypothetical protein